MKLELNQNFVASKDALVAGNHVILVTPSIDEDYWKVRVKLNKKGQAILGFPKFWTIGIGFAQEEDWNVNLPFTTDAEEIYQHIKHNKGDKSIPKKRCIEAIKMVQKAVVDYNLKDED